MPGQIYDKKFAEYLILRIFIAATAKKRARRLSSPLDS